MFNYKHVSLKKSEHTSVAMIVPVWELPILAFVHGEDKVVMGEDYPVRHEKPEPEAEYERLKLRYRSNADGRDFVSEVYGVGPLGLKNLTDAMGTVEEYSEAAPADTGDLGETFGLGDDDPTAGLYDPEPRPAGIAAGAQPIDE